jgi:hypothetical protein
MNRTETKLVALYIALASLGSAAIPLGSIYIKFDWIGAVVLCLYGVCLFLLNRLSQYAIAFSLVFLSYLLINGLVFTIALGSGFDFDRFLRSFLQFALALMVSTTVVSMRLRKREVIRLLHVWIVIAAIASVLAIAQKLSGSLLVDKFLFIPYYEGNSISLKVVFGLLASTAWFSEASWFGSFLVVPTVYLFFQVLNSRYLDRALFMHGVAFSLLIIGIFLSYSLAASLSLVAGAGVTLVVSRRARWTFPAVFVVASLLLVSLANSPLVELQLQRFVELANSIADFRPGSEIYGRATSFYVRSVGLYDGFLAFLRSPFIGTGLAQSASNYHSGIITLLGELGVVGTVLYFFSPVVVAIRLWTIGRQEYSSDRVLCFSMIACLVADYANGMITHNAFHLQRWLLLSIVGSWILRRGMPTVIEVQRLRLLREPT